MEFSTVTKVDGQRPIVVVTGGIHPAGIERLQQSCTVRLWEEHGVIPRATLLSWLNDADALVSSSGVLVDAPLLAAAPQLRVIAQSSVGYDNVDVSACKRAGVPFANTPGVLVDATADLTYALILMVMRRLVEAVDHVRLGMWNDGITMPYGHDLGQKTLGIVGMGDIGTAVARRARASNMKIVYHNRRRRLDDETLDATHLPLAGLLAQSDCVVVLTPLSPATEGLFGSSQFANMKPGSFFVNASRGLVVDTAALVTSLESGHLAGAALDVTDPEPLPADHALLKMKNVVVTPHIGSATHETRTAMALLTADNIIRGLARQPLLSEVTVS